MYSVKSSGLFVKRLQIALFLVGRCLPVNLAFCGIVLVFAGGMAALVSVGASRPLDSIGILRAIPTVVLFGGTPFSAFYYKRFHSREAPLYLNSGMTIDRLLIAYVVIASIILAPFVVLATIHGR